MAAVLKLPAALLALHRDAGIVAHLLPRAGERVEQRRLSCIGVADKRDAGQRLHLAESSSVTCIALAWLRRSEIGRAHVRTPVTNAPVVHTLSLTTQKQQNRKNKRN